LTPEGASFLAVVENALLMIGNASGVLRNAGQTPHVTIRTDPEFASFWLLPVINRFNARHPRVVTSIISDRGDMVPDPQSPDLDIAFGEGTWTGLTSHRLFYEEVFPVCSPAYLESCNQLENVEHLAKATLLGWHPSRWSFMDWEEWLERVGAPHIVPPTRLIFDDYHVAIRAAVNGQGIALAWRYCLGDLIERNDLVRIVPETVLTQRGQFLIEPLGGHPSTATTRLSQWIVASSRSIVMDQERRLAPV
jgi:DNA-binding transcriptional LysR family regulator